MSLSGTGVWTKHISLTILPRGPSRYGVTFRLSLGVTWPGPESRPGHVLGDGNLLNTGIYPVRPVLDLRLISMLYLYTHVPTYLSVSPHTPRLGHSTWSPYDHPTRAHTLPRVLHRLNSYFFIDLFVPLLSQNIDSWTTRTPGTHRNLSGIIHRLCHSNL